jgi:eukaryotic-like serine/threonine-protein kinase
VAEHEVGELQLIRVVGAGAVAEVWQATRHGLTVAVKLFKDPLSSDDAMFGFDNEARSLASLRHRHILPICDRGVSGDPPRPFLVMPLMSGGSLSQWTGRIPWAVVARITLQTLAGLAAAHAAGVVHRDLKPSNLLLDRKNPSAADVRIADFGVALSLKSAPRGHLAAYRMGTPAYMAPEQITHSLRDQGPWTDLYALGCVVVALLRGIPPHGTDTEQVMGRHLHEDPPALPSGLAPDWVDHWLARMLEKDPLERFRSAADAAATLEQLLVDAPPWQAPSPSPAPPRRAPVQSNDLTETLLEPAAPEQRQPRPLHGVAPVKPITAPIRDVPPPEVVLAELPYRGLGLIGLAPLLHAHPEVRQAIWTALRRVDRARRPVAMLVEGPLRAVAVDAAVRELEQHCGVPVFRATHHPTPDPGAGLPGLVARAGRTAGLEMAPACQRLESRAPGWGDVLARLAIKEDGDAPLRRYRALAALVAHVERPAVILLEDVQHDAFDALAFAGHLLGTHQALPVLLVLTCRKEMVAARPAIAASVAALGELEHHATGLLTSAAIGAEAQAQVTLCARDQALLIEASAGDPRVTRELLAHWAAVGALEPTDEGVAVRAAIPPRADLVALATDRWRHTMLRWTPEERECLVLAAILGQTVPSSLWQAVCEQAELVVPEARLEQVRATGMIVDSALHPGSWRFVGPPHRTALRRLGGARSPQLHNLVAEVLLAGARAPGRRYRAARHLIAAERQVHALALLLAAGQAWCRSGDIEHARAALELRETLIASVGLTAEDPRISSGWRTLAAVAIQARDHRASERWSTRLADWAKAHGDPLLGAVAARDQARTLWAREGDAAGAVELLTGALAKGVLDPRTEATLLRHLGWMHRRLGAFEEAASVLARGRTLARVSGDRATEAACTWGLGDVARERSDHAGARRNLEAALLYYHQTGAAGMAATLRNTLGEVERADGHLERARGRYREALAEMRLIASPNWPYPAYNLALVALMDEAFEEAGATLDALVSSFEPDAVQRNAHRWMEPTVRVARVWVDALRGDWAQFDADLASASRLDPIRGADSALPGLLVRAAEAAQDAGHPDRAARAQRVSEELGAL